MNKLSKIFPAQYTNSKVIYNLFKNFTSISIYGNYHIVYIFKNNYLSLRKKINLLLKKKRKITEKQQSCKLIVSK